MSSTEHRDRVNSVARRIVAATRARARDRRELERSGAAARSAAEDPDLGVGDAASTGDTDGQTVTASLWGQVARDRSESEAWRARFWQSHPVTAASINRRISGDPTQGWVEYTKRRHIIQPVERGLSLGCGAGSLERELLRLDVCRSIDAFDVAPDAIEVARAAAESAGLGDRLHYEVRDLNGLQLDQTYDAVFVAQSLHHIERLEHVLSEVAKALKPGSWFVMNEYIGPDRFQWSDSVEKLMNDLLGLLPAELKILPDGSTKGAIVRNSVEAVIAVDPSEAIRSAAIMDVVAQKFEIVERIDFGGTLLQFVLSEIAMNFDPGNPAHVSLLELLVEYERVLVDHDVIGSDFVYLVARAPMSP